MSKIKLKSEKDVMYAEVSDADGGTCKIVCDTYGLPWLIFRNPSSVLAIDMETAGELAQILDYFSRMGELPREEAK